MPAIRITPDLTAAQCVYLNRMLDDLEAMRLRVVAPLTLQSIAGANIIGCDIDLPKWARIDDYSEGDGAYDWTEVSLLTEGGFTAKEGGLSGTAATGPLYEVSGNPAVPLDAIVRIYKGFLNSTGEREWLFVYVGDEAPQYLDLTTKDNNDVEITSQNVYVTTDGPNYYIGGIVNNYAVTNNNLQVNFHNYSTYQFFFLPATDARSGGSADSNRIIPPDDYPMVVYPRQSITLKKTPMDGDPDTYGWQPDYFGQDPKKVGMAYGTVGTGPAGATGATGADGANNDVTVFNLVGVAASAAGIGWQTLAIDPAGLVDDAGIYDSGGNVLSMPSGWYLVQFTLQGTIPGRPSGGSAPDHDVGTIVADFYGTFVPSNLREFKIPKWDADSLSPISRVSFNLIGMVQVQPGPNRSVAFYFRNDSGQAFTSTTALVRIARLT